jgi:phosphoglycolate phosphatase-like HAD superfamily hydrolase
VPQDPLPSWNGGAAKARLLDFVTRVTTEGTTDFVPVANRVAAFDNDGTLWPEQPICTQFVFAFDRLNDLARSQPELRRAEPFRTILEGGLNTLVTLGEKGIVDLIKATQSGISTEEYSNIVAGWLAAAKDPRFGRSYNGLSYQPMLELLDHLRANEFRSFIVSGTGADFARVFAEEIYRIPPERVVGSTTVVEFRLGKAGPLLMKIPEVEIVRDGAGKPEAMERFIGRRPILAFGNSDSDTEMLLWTSTGAGPRFVGLVHHTDAEREWAYDREAAVGRLDKALDLSAANDWVVVDMATDWSNVFPPADNASKNG